MTDIDPRLEAVAKALRPISGVGKGLAKWWAELLCTGHDALRAFDQAANADPRCPNCRGITEHLAWCPYGPSQPEPLTIRVDATAPVMGADPPWLDEATEVLKTVFAASKDNDWKDGLRAVLAFANAQPPSEAEIAAAYEAWRYEPGDNEQAIRATLIAAAKARSGA